jgi:hypothetical protein
MVHQSSRNWYGLIMVNAVTNKFAVRAWEILSILQRPSNKCNTNLNTNLNQVDNKYLLDL